MTRGSTEIAGIVLAAGEGKRIGRNKALLEIGGIQSLEIVAACMRSAGCDPVIVVGGAEADSVRREAAHLGVRFVLNENWRSGQFSSLKAGMAQVPGVGGTGDSSGTAVQTGPPVRGVMVALVDHPFVKSETYQILVGAFRKSPGRVIIPAHNGRRGHPVVVPCEVVTEVIGSPDGITLRDIVKRHEGLVIEQTVDDAGILKDIDTEADLRRDSSL